MALVKKKAIREVYFDVHTHEGARQVMTFGLAYLCDMDEGAIVTSRNVRMERMERESVISPMDVKKLETELGYLNNEISYREYKRAMGDTSFEEI